jgi:hypothetical protein
MEQMDNLPKIECETVESFKSKITGKAYNSKEDFLKENKEEDLVVDLIVKVTNEGLAVFQKVMDQK